jgi:uncharacterized membrane protein
MCTDAYREALTRALSSTASSTPAPNQRQAAEAGREGVAQDDLEGRDVVAAGAVAGSGPAMVLARDQAI